MVQSDTSKSEQAEERSADTKSFVRQIRNDGLVKSPEMKMAAGKEYYRKTIRPHQMRATDASYFRVASWGYYYMVTAHPVGGHCEATSRTSRQMSLKAKSRSHFGSDPIREGLAVIIAVPFMLVANRSTHRKRIYAPSSKGYYVGSLSSICDRGKGSSSTRSTSGSFGSSSVVI